MTQVLEDQVRKFCAAWGDGSAASRPDVNGILAMLSEDAEWQLWVPGGPTIKGHAALRAEIGRRMAFASNNLCVEISILSNHRMVMQERSDQASINGRSCPHQLVAIYEFDDAGLIRRWREYLDMADLKKKNEDGRAGLRLKRSPWTQFSQMVPSPQVWTI